MFRQYFIFKFFCEEKFKTLKFFVKSLSDKNVSIAKKGNLRYKKKLNKKGQC